MNGVFQLLKNLRTRNNIEPDEGGPLAHLLELASANVGAGGPDAAEHVQHGGRHVPSVRHLHGLALACPVWYRLFIVIVMLMTNAVLPNTPSGLFLTCLN